MKCPECSETLIISERQGIEIDYCPKCRGVWLDKGELDKIIERSSAMESSYQAKSLKRGDDYDDQTGYLNRMPKNKNESYPRKKGGFLGDLFDF